MRCFPPLLRPHVALAIPAATLLLISVLWPAWTFAQTTELACGDVFTGSIEGQGESDLFAFTGFEGARVVVTLAQDGTWPFFTGPQALVFEPGAATPFRVITEASVFTTLFDSPLDIAIGPLVRVTSSILAGSSVGAARYQFVIGDFPPPASGIIVLPTLNAEFGASGANTLFPGAVLGSPLVPIVNDGDNDNDEGNAAFGGLDASSSEAQEGLLGCGTQHFSDCDGLVAPGPDGVLGTDDDTQTGGVDLAKADVNVLLQAFPLSGTELDPDWDTADAALPQPGTVDAVFNDGPGGGVDSRDSTPGEIETGRGRFGVRPGAHYDPAAFADVFANAAANGIDVDDWVEANLAAYDVAADGSVGCTTPTGCRRHPFTGQLFSSEMAIASWNLLMLGAALSALDFSTDPSRLDRNQPLAMGRCSFRQPQHCVFVSALVAHLMLGGRVTLPSRGTHTILVRASDLSATGPYVLELTCPAACADGGDNDSDGRIDLEDQGCASPSDTSEFDLSPELWNLWQCRTGPELLALVPLFAAARRRAARIVASSGR
jgi:hypothetical protein